MSCKRKAEDGENAGFERNDGDVKDQSTPAGTYRIFVRNLVVAARIGVHPHEKLRPPRLRVTVELEMSGAGPAADELSEVLDYERVVEGIRALALARHINLVETFAAAAAGLCLEDARVRVARVSVEKLDVYPDTESVGVTIERHR